MLLSDASSRRSRLPAFCADLEESPGRRGPDHVAGSNLEIRDQSGVVSLRRKDAIPIGQPELEDALWRRAVDVATVRGNGDDAFAIETVILVEQRDPQIVVSQDAGRGAEPQIAVFVLGGADDLITFERGVGPPSPGLKDRIREVRRLGTSDRESLAGQHNQQDEAE